jgi:hypothetical protein
MRCVCVCGVCVVYCVWCIVCVCENECREIGWKEVK